MSLERNFSLKLVRVTSPGYFRSSKFSSDTSWSSASEEAKEWAAGSDCKKPAGRGFNRRRGRAPSPGRGTGTLQSVVHIGCIWRLLSLYWGGRWPAPQTQKTAPQGAGAPSTSDTAATATGASRRPTAFHPRQVFMEAHGEQTPTLHFGILSLATAQPLGVEVPPRTWSRGQPLTDWQGSGEEEVPGEVAQEKDTSRPRHYGLISLSTLHKAALPDRRGSQTRRASLGPRDMGRWTGSMA